MAACACCFTTGLVWLHPSRADWPPSYSYRGRIGSLALRLACSPPESASPLLELALVRLHAEQAIYMVNSFQFTRSARLILAYPTITGVGRLRSALRRSSGVLLSPGRSTRRSRSNRLLRQHPAHAGAAYDVVGGLAVPGKPGVSESGRQVGSSQGKANLPPRFHIHSGARLELHWRSCSRLSNEH